MADRRSVRAELERKRIQLAQMRQERERRSAQLLQEGENSSRNSDIRERMEDADAILQAVGISTSLSRASTAPSNVSSMDQARLLAASPDVTTVITSQNFSSSLNDQFVMQSTPKTAVPLEVVHVNQINIPPKERVYYTKSTQTLTPTTPPHQVDQPPAPQGDTPQQKSYYGKQTNSTNSLALQKTPTHGQRNHPSTTNNNSLNNTNTQVTGANVNQLALEWDDEFPGMSRVESVLLKIAREAVTERYEY